MEKHTDEEDDRGYSLQEWLLALLVIFAITVFAGIGIALLVITFL